MAARRRQTRSASRPRGPKNQVWTAVASFDNVVPIAGTIAFNLVEDGDWTVRTGAEKATILSVRGTLAVRPNGLLGVAGDMPAYIHLIDESATSPSAGTPSTYTEQDILWTGLALLPDDSDATWTHEFILDVKAMRKIRKGQQLRLVMTNLTLEILHATCLARTLVRLGGN